MAKLTNAEAMEGMVAIKRLHDLAEKTGNQGIIRAAKALHEQIKRHGEAEHPDVIAMGGDT